MMIFLAAQSARVLVGDPSEGTDHTQQIAVVAQFLADGDALTVSPAAEIMNRDNPSQSTLPDFRAYASECPIDHIKAVASASKPLPIMVSWNCLRLVEIDGKPWREERSAGLWVENGTIVKIAFGRTPTLRLGDARK